MLVISITILMLPLLSNRNSVKIRTKDFLTNVEHIKVELRGIVMEFY